MGTTTSNSHAFFEKATSRQVGIGWNPYIVMMTTTMMMTVTVMMNRAQFF